MTLYDELDVPATATATEIKSAFRRLAQDYHPDRNQGATEAVRRLAEERLRTIVAAYDTLKDPDKRRRYDASLRVKTAAAATPDSTARASRAERDAQQAGAERRAAREAAARKAADEATARRTAEAAREVAQLRRRIQHIAQRRAQIEREYSERMAETLEHYRRAQAVWRTALSERRQLRRRALELWLPASLGAVGAAFGLSAVVAPALAGRVDGAPLAILFVVLILAFELGLGWWVRRATLGLSWRGVGVTALVVLGVLGLDAVLAVVEMLTVWRATWPSPMTLLWPISAHAVVGLLVGLAPTTGPTPARELPEHAAHLHQERERAVSAFDASASVELRALLRRLRAYETGLG